MIGGNPRNPREMQMMMRRLGLTTEPLANVEEVIVRTRDQEHVFRSPEVTIMTVKGVRTYQIVGTAEVRGRTAGTGGGAAAPAAPPPPSGPPEDDIALVMEQAGVERDEAIEALNSVNGAPAEAILALLSRRESGGG